MENLNKYFEESNLSQSEKDKAFSYVQKLNGGMDFKNAWQSEGWEELFYIICKFNSKEDFIFQGKVGDDVSCCLAERNYEWFSNIYPDLNKISSEVFKVENLCLQITEDIMNEKGENTGYYRIELSFDYNQEKYTKETVSDDDIFSFIFNTINNFIKINNLSEKRFLISYTGGMDHFVVFIDYEQIGILNKYFQNYPILALSDSQSENNL